MNSRKRTSAYGNNVHTLAQVGTKKTSTLPKGYVIVNGKGSDLNDLKTKRGRAKKKQISQVLALGLIKIAQEKKNRTLEIKFRNTYYCLDSVVTVDGRIHGKLCKNRLCTVCLGIRKAEIINKYLPDVSLWDEPHFLTLTVKSIKKGSLQAVIKKMKQEFRKILDTYKKRHQRGKGEKLVGLMSIECNFNPITKEYNPHLHIITNNRNTGEILRKEWLKRAKKGKAVAWAQHLIKVKNNKDCLIEIVKYGSKILTENDLNKKASSGKNVTIYLKALYTIIEAFEGIRLFESFGFKPIKKPNKEAIPAKIAVDFKEFFYDSTKTDWIDISNRETLTGFISDQRIQHILDNCIDTESS
jgi:hypothetical protein